MVFLTEGRGEEGQEAIAYDPSHPFDRSSQVYRHGRSPYEMKLQDGGVAHGSTSMFMREHAGWDLLHTIIPSEPKGRSCQRRSREAQRDSQRESSGMARRARFGLQTRSALFGSHVCGLRPYFCRGGLRSVVWHL